MNTVILWIAFALVTTNTVMAQSSDIVRYYLLYDVSGSVPINDIHGNIKELSNQLINIEDGTSKSPFSIELIGFGEGISRSSMDLYEDDVDIEKTRKELAQNFQKLSRISIDTKSQRYTHLLEALLKV